MRGSPLTRAGCSAAAGPTATARPQDTIAADEQHDRAAEVLIVES